MFDKEQLTCHVVSLKGYWNIIRTVFFNFETKKGSVCTRNLPFLSRVIRSNQALSMRVLVFAYEFISFLFGGRIHNRHLEVPDFSYNVPFSLYCYCFVRTHVYSKLPSINYLCFFTNGSEFNAINLLLISSPSGLLF